MCTNDGHDAMRAARAATDYSHATTRQWCGANVLYLYRVAPESPSGVALTVGGDADCPTCRAIVNGPIHVGPTRGDLAFVEER